MKSSRLKTPHSSTICPGSTYPSWTGRQSRQIFPPRLDRCRPITMQGHQRSPAAQCPIRAQQPAPAPLDRTLHAETHRDTLPLPTSLSPSLEHPSSSWPGTVWRCLSPLPFVSLRLNLAPLLLDSRPRDSMEDSTGSTPLATCGAFYFSPGFHHGNRLREHEQLEQDRGMLPCG